MNVLVRLLPIVAAFLVLACGREPGPTERRAREIFAKAKDAFERGDHRESKRLLRESLSLSDYFGDDAQRAETSLLLGETCAAAAEFDTAFVLFKQARALYQQLSDRAGIRASVLALAAAYRVRNEDQKAGSVLADELRLEEALGDTYGIHRLKFELIPVYRALGDVSQEQQLLSDLLRAYTALHDNAKLAAVHAEFGESALARKDLPKALKSFSAAIPFALSAADTLLAAHIYSRIAVVCDRLGKTREAFQMFTESLRRTELIPGAELMRLEILVRVGNIYLRGKQYDDARRFLNTALRSAIKTQNKTLEGYALLQLGYCLDAAGNNDAGETYAAGLELLGQVGGPRTTAFAHFSMGMYDQQNGRLNDALEHLRSAAACYDSSFGLNDDDVFLDCEQTGYQSQRASPYDALIALLFRIGKPDEAFAADQQRRQGRWRRAFAQMTLKTGHAALDSTLATFSDVRGAYIGAEHQLLRVHTVRGESGTLAVDLQNAFVQASRRMNELADSLAASVPRLRSALILRGATIEEVQRNLSETGTLVAYVPTPQALQIVIVSKQKSSAHVAAIGEDELRGLMRDYLHLLRQLNGEPGKHARQDLLRQFQSLSAHLYAHFVRPLELNVAGSTELALMLPAELPFIPVHALQQEGRKGECAIQRFSIRYLPDADALTLGGTRMNTTPAVVGFGNQGRTSIDVEYEVRDAKAFYKEAKLFFGGDANLQRLSRERGDILHVAAEMQYVPDAPGNSFFVLAGGSGYSSSRYYRFGELFSVAPFPTVLVSNLSDAELDPLLPRIFLMNGTADVVINSYVGTRKAKKFFNEHFYTNLLAGSSVEAAYRNAVLEMIRNPDYALPATWAEFSVW